MASADILRAAHTPGPWGVIERNEHFLVIQDLEPKKGKGRVRLPTATVAACHVNAEANARLICAAPQMLEALKVAQASLAMLTEPAHVRTSTVHQAWGQAVEAELKVRLAIAAAEAEAGR